MSRSTEKIPCNVSDFLIMRTFRCLCCYRQNENFVTLFANIIFGHTKDLSFNETEVQCSLNLTAVNVNGNQHIGSPAQKKFATLMGMEQMPYFLICSAAARAAASAFFPFRPFDLEPIPDSSTGMSILNYGL